MSMQRLQALNKQLDGNMTTLKLFESGHLTRSASGEMLREGVKAWTVFADEASNIVASNYDATAEWPSHEHTESVEYLICTSGEFEILLILPEGDTRWTLRRGGCFKLPERVLHSVRCVQSGKLLAVCIPPEKGYLK